MVLMTNLINGVNVHEVTESHMQDNFSLRVLFGFEVLMHYNYVERVDAIAG